MDFERDETKNHRNLAKHAISFEEPTSVFAGPTCAHVAGAREGRKRAG
jgi:uncharacterized DUF497 family protein